MPGVVKTPRDKHKWEKAVSISEDAGKGGNYAYIMGIYKKMKPDYTFKSNTKLAFSIYLLSKEIRGIN